MPPKSNKKHASDVSDSESEAGSVAGSEASSTTGKKRRVRKDFTPFDFEAFKPENRKYPHLDSKEFKLMVDTLVDDAKNVIVITQAVYGGKDDNYTKLETKRFATQFITHLKQVNAYHKAKGVSNRTQSAQHLTEPFFVTDNIHDWINGINMGNGLAHYLVHVIPGRDDETDVPNEEHAKTIKAKHDADEFIRLANSQLKGERKTDKDELMELIYVHHDAYTASGDVEKSVFQTDKESNVVANDPTVLRIVEVYNAYATAYNKKYGLKVSSTGHKPQLTAKEAAANAVPQTANIPYEGGTVNVSEILDVVIQVHDPFSPDDEFNFNTSAINSGMNTTILTLMSNANQLSEPENGRLIHYDLFEKYFNGNDQDYPQGKTTGFYFSERDENGEVSELHDLSFSAGNGKKISATDVAGGLRDSDNFPFLAAKSKSKSQANQVDALARRISNVYSGKPMTAFQLMNSDYMASKEKYIAEHSDKAADVEADRPYVEYEEDEPYGIRNFSGTKICFMFKVGEDFLAESARELLAETDFKAKVMGVQKYLSKLNAAYTAYLHEEKALLARARKAAQTKAKKSAAQATSPALKKKKVATINVTSPIGKKVVKDTPKKGGKTSPTSSSSKLSSKK